MARYRGPKDRSRSISFRIDFSDREKRQLLELADDRGVPMAGWIRMAIREAHEALERARVAEEAGARR